MDKMTYPLLSCFPLGHVSGGHASLPLSLFFLLPPPPSLLTLHSGLEFNFLPKTNKQTQNKTINKQQAKQGDLNLPYLHMVGWSGLGQPMLSSACYTFVVICGTAQVVQHVQGLPFVLLPTHRLVLRLVDVVTLGWWGCGGIGMVLPTWPSFLSLNTL